MRYKGTFSCGHEGEIKISGDIESNQWKIDEYFSGICEECLRKQRQEELTKAIEKSKEYGFPDLISGTNKQIDWANVIRVQFYDYWCSHERWVDVEKVLKRYVDAKFWIDNRSYCLTREFFRDYSEKERKEYFENQIISMDTVKPSEIEHDGVVEIVEKSKRICLIYEKDEDFINLVKEYGYRWDKMWYKELTETTGLFADRAAEIGHILLKNGFCICIHDKEITEKAIDGVYEAEWTRWIDSVWNTDCLKIKWRGMNEALFKKAIAIKNAQKVFNEGIIVNVSHYRSVEKFARDNGFKFTCAAKRKIDDYKLQMKKIREVKVK